MLWELGTIGIEVKTPPGKDTVLLACFERASSEPLLETLRQALAPLHGRVRPAAVPDVDWVARAREAFRPLDLGRFRLVPAWDRPETPPPGRRLLVVEPGRAFGTGTHETTRLCLLALDELADRAAARRVVDVGTGSGILAVASALCGSTVPVGIDLDADALAVARRHADLNGVRVHLVRADGGRPLQAGGFDLVLANLSLALLEERRSELLALAAPRGRLVLSGFLARDAAQVAQAWGGAGRVALRSEGEWGAAVVETGR